MITLLIAAAILLADSPRLIRSRLWGEVWTRSVLTLAAALLVALPAFYIKIPPMLKLLVIYVEPWGKALTGWLR